MNTQPESYVTYDKDGRASSFVGPDAVAAINALRALVAQAKATSAWEDAQRGEDPAMLEAVQNAETIIAAGDPAHALLRSLVADIDAMNLPDEAKDVFGPFSEGFDWPMGFGVVWPNLAILRDEAKALLEALDQ